MISMSAVKKLSVAIAAGSAMEPLAGPGKRRLATRYGDLDVDVADAIRVPNGLLGFPEQQSFVLATLADPRFARLMVLQCLEDSGLSFLVMPIDPAGGLLDAKDVSEAGAVLAIAPGDLAVALIVAIRKTANAVEMTANLRAPLFFDVGARRCFQYVLNSGAYALRHPVTEMVFGETAPVK